MIQNCSYFLSELVDYKIFSLLSVVIAGLFGFYLLMVMHRHIAAKIFIAMFFAGSTLNALDRWNDGCVNDYLDFFGLFKYNIFDIMICLASAVLIYLILYEQSNSTYRR